SNVKSEEAKALIKVIAEDFFHMSKGHVQKYDIVFDSTFLCAIQPDSRLDWAKSMSAVLKPGGILVQNIYPSKPLGEEEISMKDEPGSGPPFQLSVKLATELLAPYGFETVLLEQAPVEKRSRGDRGGDKRLTNEIWVIWRAPESIPVSDS